jgi:RNA polymerase sigma factor (sigma-70 family)
MSAQQHYSDQELIRAIRQGTSVSEPVQFLYRSHFESLSWYVKNNQGSQQDAEDIFQEVMVSFIDIVKKDKFRGESSVKTFLFALNRNTWLNELKRRSRALVREERFEQAKATTDLDVSHFIAGREARVQLMQVLDELGDLCKKILLLYYFENLSMKDIAAQSDYENEQVVRNKKYKCLKQLEQMITSNPILEKTIKNALSYES